MNCTTIREKIDDYVDGELTQVEQAAVEAHLSECASCRAEAESIRALAARARALRRDMAPERDPWPEIARRINRGKILMLFDDGRSTLMRHRRMVIAAAACVAMIAATWIIARYAEEPSGNPPVAPVVAGSESGQRRPENETGPDSGWRRPQIVTQPSRRAGTPEGGSDIDHGEYLRVRRHLESSFEARRDELAPETMEVIEKNLSVIDDAIGEINRALEDDPGDPNLKLMLITTRRRAVELLEQATRIPTNL